MESHLGKVPMLETLKKVVGVSSLDYEMAQGKNFEINSFYR